MPNPSNDPLPPPSPRWKITGSFPIEVRRHRGGVHISLAFTEKEALVELTTMLTSGGNAKAKVLWRQGGTWSQADTDEITVYDAVGTMEGNVGDKALVKFHRQSGLWIVWQLQC
jgi:hypothetical protein